MPVIALRLLGQVEVSVDRDEPPPELLWKKNLALLAYLALSPRQARSREHLIGLFWSEKPESAARHSLNEALRIIRRSVGDTALHTDASTVRLDAGAVELDVTAFAAHERAGDWEAAAALVRGHLLDGIAIPGESAFEDWVTAERGQWQRRATASLVNAAESSLARGKTAEGRAFAERALALDPTSGSAFGVHLRALALSGERSTAVAEFERYRDMLAARLELAPEPALVELMHRIRAGRTEPVAGGEATDIARTRRLPLIGREVELAMLWDSWRRCRRTRETTIAVILADPGLGKTRLLEELRVRAELEGAGTLTIRGVEADRHAPWSGILGLGRGGLLQAPGIATAPASAHAAFAREIAEWGDRYRGATGVDPAPLPRAFSELVRAAAEERPTLLVLDDCHLLDTDSLECVTALSRDMPSLPLMMVLAAEPAVPSPPLDALRSRLGRDLAGAALELGALGPGVLAQMARTVFPEYDDAAIDRLARRLAADSAGVPLLAVEFLHGVASGLDWQRTSGTWPAPYHTLTETSPGELPDSLTAAVRIGYRKLTEPAQRALAAVAALGGPLTASAIGQAAALPADSLRMALDELEWQRWLVADGRGYSFVAGIVERIVQRDMLTPGQLRRFRAAADGQA